MESIRHATREEILRNELKDLQAYNNSDDTSEVRRRCARITEIFNELGVILNKKDNETKLNQILKARGSVYGSFMANADVSQKLKNLYRNTNNWGGLSYDIQEMLDMIALKISRILTGNDPEHVDNFRDIAGYATIVADRIDNKERS